MNVEAYLSRIEYDGPIAASEEVLERLCWCHVSHVPFFTLDLFGSSDKKVMDLDVLYRKIVTERTGGICYELNGLFSWLLRRIGFDVKIVRTEALINDRYGGSLVNEHLALIVTLQNGEQRIADVSALALPLRFDIDRPQYQRNTKARAIRRWSSSDNGWYIYVEKLERTAVDNISSDMQSEQTELSWRGRYRFRPTAANVELSYFQANLDATVSTQGSLFTTTSFCVLQTDGGINALICRNYIEKDCVDIKRTSEIKDMEEFRKILSERFGIALSYEIALPENNIF